MNQELAHLETLCHIAQHSYGLVQGAEHLLNEPCQVLLNAKVT